ncbi:hypothetical protein [Bradyrhizobium sp. 179]|uniref:hypothetical protein n=1 Tax=Bradyrhizobium sp. 179 TaxID=2782648 RepID=UPI001FF72A84|nr:hypothetical protein [Bradyrhizobium sp. 179]
MRGRGRAQVRVSGIQRPVARWPRPSDKPVRVEPKFYADVEYREITSEGLLRASLFKGLSKGTRRSYLRFSFHSVSRVPAVKPDRVRVAVKQAQVILASYVEPGSRDGNKTINDLLDVLDDEELIEAMEREDAQGTGRIK